MFDQDQFNDGQPNQDGVYHYSFLPTQNEPQAGPGPVPPQPPQKKKGFAGKAVALVLCCAVDFG